MFKYFNSNVSITCKKTFLLLKILNGTLAIQEQSEFSFGFCTARCAEWSGFSIPATGFARHEVEHFCIVELQGFNDHTWSILLNQVIKMGYEYLLNQMEHANCFLNSQFGQQTT